jgi:hypothetical protein
VNWEIANQRVERWEHELRRSLLVHLEELAFLPHASAFQSRKWGCKKLHALLLLIYFDSWWLVVDKRVQLELQLEFLHNGPCLQVAWWKFVHLLPWSALIVDLVLWHSSSFSLAMNELCLPCARLLCLSSSPVWVHLRAFLIWIWEFLYRG